MVTVTLNRKSDNSIETLGALTIEGNDFTCYTLELPWKDNQHDISCIPNGSYICHWQWSQSHQMFNYHILNVPNRAGCEIHSANLVSQLLGCIALGLGERDINGDGELDVINSRDAINQFVSIMKQEDFTLIINGIPAA